MTIAQTVAKARRELKKLLAQAEESTAYMSKERFIIPIWWFLLVHLK